MTSVLYDELSRHYDEIVDKDTSKEVEFLESVLNEGTVLDLACGNGRHSCRLLERGFEPTGVDLSEQMIEKARRRCDAEFFVGNLLELDFDRSFENAILMWTTINLFSREEMAEIIENVSSKLVSDGIFILDTKPYPGDGVEENSRIIDSRGKRIEVESRREYRDRERSSLYRYNVEDRETGEVEEYTDEEEAFFPPEKFYREKLRAAGFKVEKVYRGYDMKKTRGDRMIFRARKENLF